MQRLPSYTVISACILLLGLLPLAIAHGHRHGDGDMAMEMGESSNSRPIIPPQAATDGPQSYFQYGDRSGLMLAHIVVMTLAWVFVLPIGVLLSIARSRYTLLTHFAFLVVNAAGILLSTIYNASTPDLYPNNAHHKLGWLLTWVVSAQVMMGVINAYTRKERVAYIPISSEAMAEHQRMEDLRFAETYRFSNDSGQGTEPNTESLRSQSISSTGTDDHQLLDVRLQHEEQDQEVEKQGLLNGGRLDGFLGKKLSGLLPSQALRVFQFFYDVVDRLILILGFVALATGLVTYGGLFIGGAVFSGLAHFIKGGVFFWYGILTLGRWAGCFGDIGWAWNIKPHSARKSTSPSAEFVESFLIFFYGSTNVFLEHLAAWGSKWSSQDLEHISITVMFFGGGLCGMLIESSKVRDLLNMSRQPFADERDSQEPPKSYGFPMNPIPALIVLLLGMMMSSHHQESMVSTMIHKQWGNLLIGAAFARAATYIIYYLAPPTSVLPGRPPTELITAFCLMAGGLIFMASARDCVISMELYDLDAMFVFTVSMGLVTFLIAWTILVIAIKGMALKRENRQGSAYSSKA